MTEDSRPLSPHLQIYRWEITMVMSILHRASGVFLSMGTLYIAYWLLALAQGEEKFSVVQAQLAGLPGQLLLLVWSAALYYHLCNGIRHLFWDAGQGFEMTTVRRSGWTVIVVAGLLTALTWWLAIGAGA